MKFLFVLLLLFSVSVRADFFSGTDIPVMDGMIVSGNDDFSFDTPAGQIMALSAKTQTPAKDVEKFYQETLTALGWKQLSKIRYQRDRDELNLVILQTKGATILKLQLTFANK